MPYVCATGVPVVIHTGTLPDPLNMSLVNRAAILATNFVRETFFRTHFSFS